MGKKYQKAAGGKRPNLKRAGLLDVSGERKFSGRRGLLKVCLLAGVFAVVLAVHWPALSSRALFFDDDLYLTDNTLVQNPGFGSAKRFLAEVLEPSTVHGYYQPLTMISLMLDYAIGGRTNNLMPFHRTSLILHGVNTVLIILLLYQLFDRFWPAVGAGLLFGLHPMTVETIPWIGERKTLLSAFFALCALNSYVLSRRSSRRGLFAGSIVMYVLAVMAKPISLPLPVLMLLLDYWPLKRFSKRAVLEKATFFLIAGIFAVITIISQGRTAAITTPAEHGLGRISMVFCHNMLFYPFKILWPVNLSSYYVFPEPFGLSDPMVLAGVIWTVLLVPLLLVSVRRTRGLLAGWLFFFAAIFPTMGVIGFTIVIAADKFAYLPSVGFVMMLTSFLVWFCGQGRYAIRRAVVAIVILILAGSETIATRQNYFYWRDTVGHYEHMLTLTPDVTAMLYNLAKAFERENRTDEAIDRYHRIIKIDPNYYRAYNNLGFALKSQGQSDEAIECYRHALRIKPDFPEAYFNLGAVAQEQGRFDNAVEYFRQALRYKPDYADACYNLGNTLKAMGRFGEAVEQYNQALRYRPGDIKVLTNLGNTLSQQDRPREAILAFSEVLRLDPDSAIAHSNLGWELKKTGAVDEAIGHFNQSIRLNPGLVPPLFGLATTLAQRSGPGDIEQAIVFAERAAEITRHQDVFVLEMLADTYAAGGRYDRCLETGRQALGLADGAGNTKLADHIREKLDKYTHAAK